MQAGNEALKQESTKNTRYYAARLNEAGATIGNLKKESEELRSQLAIRLQERDRLLRQHDKDRAEISDLEQKSAPAREFPEAADLLNQLKGRRKKSKTDLADVEAILELMGDCNDG